MRHIKSIKPLHQERKIVRKFLWFPTTLQRETRWLEYANVELKYSTDTNRWNCGWCPDAFVSTVDLATLPGGSFFRCHYCKEIGNYNDLKSTGELCVCRSCSDKFDKEREQFEIGMVAHRKKYPLDEDGSSGPIIDAMNSTWGF